MRVPLGRERRRAARDGAAALRPHAACAGRRQSTVRSRTISRGPSLPSHLIPSHRIAWHRIPFPTSFPIPIPIPISIPSYRYEGMLLLGAAREIASLAGTRLPPTKRSSERLRLHKRFTEVRRFTPSSTLIAHLPCLHHLFHTPPFEPPVHTSRPFEPPVHTSSVRAACSHLSSIRAACSHLVRSSRLFTPLVRPSRSFTGAHMAARRCRRRHRVTRLAR
jgi:hypothetical protein